MDGHAKYHNHDDEDEAEFQKTKKTIGDHLADHQAKRLNRCHGELHKRTALALAEHAERDQQNDHHLQQHGSQSRHEEVCRAHRRVI